MQFTTTHRMTFSKTEVIYALASMFPDNMALKAQTMSAEGLKDVKMDTNTGCVVLAWERDPAARPARA